VLAGLGVGGIGGDRIGIVPMLNIQGYVHVLAGLLAPYLIGMAVARQASEGWSRAKRQQLRVSALALQLEELGDGPLSVLAQRVELLGQADVVPIELGTLGVGHARTDSP